MSAEQIARSLAFINWTVLAGLAVGTFATVVTGRLATPVTRGFLAFTCLCAVALGGLALLSDLGLPPATPGGVAPSDGIVQARRALLAAFDLGALVYAVVLMRGGRGVPLAAATLAAGVGALLFAALGWTSGVVAALPLLVQLGLLAASIGGVFAAMVLGHWYLVTPKLPESPLILVTRILLAVVAVQVVLFLVWMATGAGVGRPPFEPLVGQWAFLVWARFLIGLAFPLVITWAALQTAKSRSMESATGLLYIDVGAIAAGTILAAGLYFGAGLLV